MKDLNLLDEEWEFLTGFLPDDWREQARSTGALRRARGIANADCLLQLILLHPATGLSLRQTVVRAREQSIADIFDVALLKGLRSSEVGLRSLTAHLTGIRQSGLVQKVSAQRRIRVVDAPTGQEQGGAGSDWRVHYTLSLPDLSCDFFEITDAPGGETYRRIPVKPKELLLADRGYSNAAGVRAVAEAGGDVLVRWNSFSFPLQTMDGKPFVALKGLNQLPQRGCREWKVCFTQEGQRYAGRLCAIRKGALWPPHARKRTCGVRRPKSKSTSVRRRWNWPDSFSSLPRWVRTFSAPRRCWNYIESDGRSNFGSNTSRACWAWDACPSMMPNPVEPGFKPSCFAGCSSSV